MGERFVNSISGGLISVALAASTIVGSAGAAQAAYPHRCDDWRDADNSAQTRICVEFKGKDGNLYARTVRELRVTTKKAGKEKRYFGPSSLRFLAAKGSVWCNGTTIGNNQIVYLVANKAHPKKINGQWIKLRAARHEGAAPNGACKGSGNPHHGKIRMYHQISRTPRYMEWYTTRDVNFSVS